MTATLSTTIVGGNFPQRRSHLQGQEADPLLREGRQILRTWTKRGAPARAERSIATSHQTCYSSESAKWALRGRRNAREARRRQDRNHSERHIGPGRYSAPSGRISSLQQWRVRLGPSQGLVGSSRLATNMDARCAGEGGVCTVWGNLQRSWDARQIRA